MSERAAHRMQKKWQEADQAAIDMALQTLINSSEGRRYLWWLLQIGLVGQQPFTSNAMNTSFNCGQLNVGQQILAHLCAVDPAGYVAMMQEQANERSDRDTKLRDAAGGNTRDASDGDSTERDEDTGTD